VVINNQSARTIKSLPPANEEQQEDAWLDTAVQLGSRRDVQKPVWLLKANARFPPNRPALTRLMRLRKPSVLSTCKSVLRLSTGMSSTAANHYASHERTKGTGPKQTNSRLRLLRTSAVLS